MSFDLSPALKEIPGAQEFLDLLDVPDSIFNAMYPSLKVSLKQQLDSLEFKQAIIDLRSTPDYNEFLVSSLPFISELKNDTVINPNKKDFLLLLFNCFLDDGYDTEIMIELSPDAHAPCYAHLTDQGADIYSYSTYEIPPHTLGYAIATGIKVAIPEGWALAVRPRSGLSMKTGLRISNAPGTIDTGYRGDVMVLFDNLGDTPVIINVGDRVAQLILEKAYRAKWTIVDDVTKIGENRNGGFGSTGK